ncbi:MAG: ribonuclease Z [Actinomycetia bacterium]|nr:ribonuclease Z [Actinomycetes bacterium]
MSGRHLIVLGTSSQAPTRHRQHNSFALRWDDLLILFDPGEGTQRQCILAGVAIARLNAVCITHFHGDHSLGLPGVIQRRALDNRTSGRPPTPLPIFYPREGQIYFDRLRHATVFYDTSQLEPHPIEGEGKVAALNPTASLSSRALDHRISTFGFRIDEDDSVRLNRAALDHFGIKGREVGRLLADGKIETETGTVGLDQVSEVRLGQSFAFVMDTRLCDAAIELADGVDLLVCESTFLDQDRELAHRFRHLTALQAGILARDAGARRLVLAHFSARYPSNQAFADEASSVHGDVVAGEELMVIPVPPRHRNQPGTRL